jgi:calcineurin-like phosphoesterase family protein
MSKVYIISDVHFGHRNICTYRTHFESAESHDEFIFENIMKVASKRNVLWLLGDMFFDAAVVEKYGRPVSEAFMQTNFIIGNHDTDNTFRQESVRKAISLFDSVHSLHSKYGYWLSHAPIHPAELRRKALNIHGHVHFQSIRKEDGSIDDRYFNACCENINYSPVSLQDISNGYRGEIK